MNSNPIKGKAALWLENGNARLKDTEFENGIIDFDISFEQARKFVGVHFRIADEKNYEEFYLRAHQSGNPDATQYTPVINGNAGWQLYHGEGHSKAYRYNFGEWIHIRLVIAGDQMEVFINDMSQPFLHVFDLKRPQASGQIGFGTFLGSAYYANFSLQKMDNPPMKSDRRPLPPIAQGTLTGWQVSKAFPERSLAGINALEDLPVWQESGWSSIEQEYSGLINLSQVSSLSPETNSVLAKMELYSDSKQIKKLDFGYSDRVVVFVNGEIQYAGQKNFRSRDYRYLGTIGYFDSLIFKLEKRAKMKLCLP